MAVLNGALMSDMGAFVSATRGVLMVWGSDVLMPYTIFVYTRAFVLCIDGVERKS